MAPNGEVDRGTSHGPSRCDWARNDPAIRYHDEEWGVPGPRRPPLVRVPDPRRPPRPGLSWDTILKKRERLPGRLRRVRSGSRRPLRRGEGRGPARRPGDRPQPPEGQRRRHERRGLPGGPAGVRRLRRVHLAVCRREADPQRLAVDPEVPARSEQSDTLSKDLKRRRFTFVGTTICYALMQATGMVNDHLVGYFRHGEVVTSGRAGERASNSPSGHRPRCSAWRYRRSELAERFLRTPAGLATYTSIGPSPL